MQSVFHFLYDHTNVSVLDLLPGLYIERADAYAAIEEYRRAIIDYSNAIKLEPNYALAYIGRGTAYTRIKEYEHAIVDFSHVLKLEPKNATAYIERGRTYRLLKKYDRALEDFSYALSLSPRNARAYLDRGITFLLLKDIRRANRDFNKSLELDATDINALWISQWAVMCLENVNARMIARLQATVVLNPFHYVGYVCSSVILGLQGRFDEAVEELERIIISMPDEWDAYFWKGMVCASLGRDIEAMAVLEYAIVLGMPPILLLPLRWLEKTRPDFYKHVVSLLPYG